MNLLKSATIVLLTLSVAACSTLRKTKNTTTPSTASETPKPAPAIPGLMNPTPKPKTGIFAPGADELAAIQTKYSETTMKMLQEGYQIYTGICTGCHEAKSIYSRPESAWPDIIKSMAIEARITPAQKEAVYKYVMSIKATQNK